MESAKWYIARLHARERAAARREQDLLQQSGLNLNLNLNLSLKCGTSLRPDWHVLPVSPSVSLSPADSTSFHETDTSPLELMLPDVPTGFADEEEKRGRSRTREPVLA